MKRWIIVIVLVALGVWVLMPSQPDDLPADKVTERGTVEDAMVVHVYSSRKEELIQPLFDAFTEESGIEVELLVDKAPSLISRLEKEGAASEADLLITADVGNLWLATSKGLLQPLGDIPPFLARIPDNYKEENGHWVGLTKRLRLIFYNKEAVSPDQLSTYLNLADEKWQGRILIRSSGNMYNQSLIAGMLYHHGPEATEAWLRGLVSNFARTPQGGDTDQLRAAAAGEGDIAIANHYYYARLLASEDAADKAIAEKLGVFLPNQESTGAHVNLSGGGVTAAADNVAGAIALLDFLAGEQGQKLYAELNHEYPVIEGIAVSDTVASFGEVKMDDAALPYLGAMNADAVALADEAGWR